MNNRTLIERLYGRVSILELEVEALKERAGEGESVRPVASVKAVPQKEKLSERMRPRGEWIPLTKASADNAPAPVAVQFPDGTEKELKYWAHLPLAIADYIGVDDVTREYIARPKSRGVCLEEALRAAGSNAENYAVAFAKEVDNDV